MVFIWDVFIHAGIVSSPADSGTSNAVGSRHQSISTDDGGKLCTRHKKIAYLLLDKELNFRCLGS